MPLIVAISRSANQHDIGFRDAALELKRRINSYHPFGTTCPTEELVHAFESCNVRRIYWHFFNDPSFNELDLVPFGQNAGRDHAQILFDSKEVFRALR